MFAPLAMNEDETLIQRVDRVPRRPGRGRAYVTALSGASVGRVFRLAAGETSLGRGTTADIQIAEDGVSRLHAKIVCEADGTAKIIDLKSTNGTYVNGRRVHSEYLREGDRIRVGQSATLDFRYEHVVQPVEEEGGSGLPEDVSAVRKQGAYDNIAGALDSLGKVYKKSKQYDQAIEAYERTLSIREKRFGPRHPAVASILDTIGVARQAKGDHREALKCHMRALEIYEGLPARQPPPEMAHVLANLGEAHLAMSRPREAIAALERGRELLEARSATSAELAQLRFSLARAYATVGRIGDETLRLAEMAKEGFRLAGDRETRGRVSEVESWAAEHLAPR